MRPGIRTVRGRGGSRRGRALVLLGLAFLAAGCLGRSPESTFYTLTPLAPAVDGTDAGPALDLKPVRLPRYLDRSAIVTRRDEGRVEIHEFHRWAAGLERELARVLGLGLARRLASERVSVYPAHPPWPVDGHVAVEIHRLDGRLGEAVELEGRFTLVAVDAPDAPGEERLLAARRLSLREPVEGDDIEALVAAHSRVVDALAGEIAAAVRDAGL